MFRQRCRVLKVLLIVVFVATVFLHFIFLPTVNGGYNDECFLPEGKRHILRTMVQNISMAFDKFGVQYWLDYGTLSFLLKFLSCKIYEGKAGKRKISESFGERSRWQREGL